MLLLSIHPRFAEAIFAGNKKVELRRRVPKLEAGDTVVVYATVPTAAIVGAFTVQRLQSSSLGDLWRRTRDVAAISSSEFQQYFSGLDTGVGIWISKATRFKTSVSLADLRVSINGFHPPQGFRYLRSEEIEIITRLACGSEGRVGLRCD